MTARAAAAAAMKAMKVLWGVCVRRQAATKHRAQAAVRACCMPPTAATQAMMRRKTGACTATWNQVLHTCGARRQGDVM